MENSLSYRIKVTNRFHKFPENRPGNEDIVEKRFRTLSNKCVDGNSPPDNVRTSSGWPSVEISPIPSIHLKIIKSS